MQPRSPVLGAILTGILSGCSAGKDGETSTTPDTSCTSSCCHFVSEHLTEQVTLTAEEVALYAGEDAILSDAECAAACNEKEGNGWRDFTCDEQTPGADGAIVLACGWDTMCEGRRTEGLFPARPVGRGAARWLARAAHAEAASVGAFRRLRAELAAHEAPLQLRDAALAAARDEVRHARRMRALAESYGATSERPRLAALPVRPLFEVARENAVEGCVHETWAALVALRQASSARDPELRAVMGAIAADEVRHAELAWAVQQWALPRLAPTERRSIANARRAAVRGLAGVRYPRTLGLPGPAEVRRMHAAMVARVWGA